MSTPLTNENADDSKHRFALWVVSLLASLGVAWTIWSVPIVMTNDGPQAVVLSHIEAHYDDPDSIFASQFSVGLGLSGRGFSLLYAAVSTLWGWPDTLRVCELIIVLSMALSVGLLCKAVSGSARTACLLGFVVAFSWPFYMGFFAFALSLAFGLMLLSFVVSRTGGLSTVQKAAVSTGVLLQLLMHGFAVLVTLALLSLTVLVRRHMSRGTTSPPEWWKGLRGDAGWLVLTALPSVATSLLMRQTQTEMATAGGSGETYWAPPLIWILTLPRMVVPGSTVLGVLVIALACFSLGRSVVRIRRGDAKPEEVALTIGASLLILIGLTAPLNVPGWQYFSPRFLTPGTAVALALLGCEKLERRSLRMAVDVAVPALVVLELVNVSAVNRRYAAACADAVAGLDHKVQRSYAQLPIIFDANCGLTGEASHAAVPYLWPAYHFHSLFAVLHGGTVPNIFAGPSAVHAFVPRPSWKMPVPPLSDWGLDKTDPRLLEPRARAALLTEQALAGTVYENILMFGANAADRALLVDRGYHVDFEQGSFINAHFEACPVEIVIERRPADPPVEVIVGFADAPAWRAELQPSSDSFSSVATAKTFCGDVWVRVAWTGGAIRCSNAGPDGDLRVRASQPVTRVACERDALRP